MLQIVYTIPQERQEQIKEFLKEYHNHFQDDVSNYAKGRKRFWIEYEADLTKKGTDHKEALHIPRLWDYVTKVCETYANFTPDLGLVAIGEKGIDWHRDASYAAFKAISINLGKADWGYQEHYSTYQWEKPQQGKHANTNNFDTYRLQGGEVIMFNCKNKHRAVPLEPSRISINLWKFK